MNDLFVWEEKRASGIPWGFDADITVWASKLSAQIKEKLMQKHKLLTQIFNTAVFALSASTPQNSQTHSNNLLLVANELFVSVFDHFVGLALKRLSIKQSC